MRPAFKLRIGIALAVLLGLGSGIWLYAQVFQTGAHPLNEACQSCHLAGAGTTAANAAMLLASQEQLCGKCHASSMQISHPSGFTPPAGQIIPATYPLDWKGDLTCSTCHQVHSSLRGKLRGTVTGRDMCLACHSQAFFDNMRDGGISVVQSGHLGALNAQNWQTLDRYSIQCMECHATRGDVNVSPNLVRHADINHPIGHNYDEATRFGSYRPAISLSKKILLPNGMIGCVSCHEGYSKNHGKVVTTGSGTSLCFECHDL